MKPRKYYSCVLTGGLKFRVEIIIVSYRRESLTMFHSWYELLFNIE